MSIRQQPWKWRHRSPRCDQCQGSDMRRLRIEVDWKAQATKMTWKCATCANCVYVISHKKQQQQAA